MATYAMRTPGPGEVKFLASEVRRIGEDGRVEGYASLFGVPDLGRDVVERGAFADSIARRGAGGIRMLWQHDPGQPVGTWLSVREDGRGLYVRGRLNLAVAKARDIAALIGTGALDGLSIGFRVVEAAKDRGTGARRLLKLDLWEVSIVTFPMLPGARVAAAKRIRGSPAPAARLALSIRRASARLRTVATKRNPMQTHAHAPEIKSATGEVALAFDDFARTFDAFRSANDERLAEIETRLSADVVTEEKLTRIDAALDEAKRRLDRVQLDRARPALGGSDRGGSAADPVVAEHKAAFDTYVRAGEAAGLKRLEAKALSAGSGPDGGYLVPPSVETEVLTRLAKLSPIRAVSSVRTISTGLYKRAFSTAGPASGWVGETASRPQTASPNLAELAYPAMELYAMPAATQTLLDDAIVDIDAWLAAEVETVFAEQEGAAFVKGDGVNKPKGFLASTAVAETGWSWGNLGYVPTGAAGAFLSESPSDALIDLIYALKAGYRQNAVFVMNRKTQSVIRKFKDDSGAYLWQPPAVAGQPATLMSFPVIEAEDMPDIGAGSLSVAFGDFRRGYLVVDRAGIRVLRDPYSAKPYVLFYTTKRVGGGVQDFDAIKLLRFAAS